jgi:hypothetical protein
VSLGTGGSWQVVVDASSGEILSQLDLCRRADFEGRVFLPDPLTTSGHEYTDPGYGDNYDLDSDSLSAQRFLVQLTGLEEDTEGGGGNGWVLSGPYVKVYDFAGPVTAKTVVPTLGDSLVFNRSEDSFEEVMVYYHIHEFRSRLQAMGVTDLQPGPIESDAHALNDEQSWYDSIDNSLWFGDGGVDDAEDADVIIHEYGHALHMDALFDFETLTYFSYETSADVDAVSEGFGDYLAASNSERVSGVYDTRVFNWDGHNDFWSGRHVVTYNSYSNWDQLSGDIYKQGTIWANALWLIREELGADTADHVVVEGHTNHLPLSDVRAAMDGVILAAELLYPESPYVADAVEHAFEIKGFIGSVSVAEAPGGSRLSRFDLSDPWPNPFNPSARVTVSLARRANVEMTVYDLLGRVVDRRTLGSLGAGSHTVVWRARPGLSSGVYLLHVAAGEYGTRVRRLVLVR